MNLRQSLQPLEQAVPTKTVPHRRYASDSTSQLDSQILSTELVDGSTSSTYDHRTLRTSFPVRPATFQGAVLRYLYRGSPKQIDIRFCHTWGLSLVVRCSVQAQSYYNPSKAPPCNSTSQDGYMDRRSRRPVAGNFRVSSGGKTLASVNLNPRTNSITNIAKTGDNFNVAIKLA